MRAITALFVCAASISTALGAPTQTANAPTAGAQLALPQPLAPTAPIPAPKDLPYPGTIALAVDASNVAQFIFKVHETIPVAKGTVLTLLYPEWRPGNHSPSARNRIVRLAGFTFTANGVPLAWSRDPVNVYAFHVTLPPKVTSVDVDFQYLAPPSSDFGRPETTTNIITLDWDAVVLYPAGYYARRIPIEPRLRVPAGWQFATALHRDTQPGDEAHFSPTTLETLVDSPVYAGSYFSRIDLDPGAKVPVYLNLFADRPELLAATPAQVNAHKALVQQAYLLFGSRHYDQYDFLVTVSDMLPPSGVEHHRSSFDGVFANYFTEWDKSTSVRSLLPHEFTHSWNGKFRRPADLWTANYNEPMRDSLLWVYEGQTQYWGNVLSARSGLWTKQQALEDLAIVTARYQAEPGRTWRPLQDTTEQPIIQYNTPLAWRSWQRSVDYYDVGSLIWLDVDTLIRERSQGQHSLDDFAKQFFGVNDGSYSELTYTFADIVAALNRVQPYDWADFLRQRLDAVNADAPTAGVTRGGYRLVFTDTPSALYKSEEDRGKVTALTYSVGLTLEKDGKIKEVLWNSPAFKAGLSPGTQIIAVDSVAFDPDRLKEVIKAAQHSTTATNLIVREGERFRTVALDYHDGLRYPHLERDPDRPALLDAILEPKK
jgi:predicted metalloprotease with PDZ domain